METIIQNLSEHNYSYDPIKNIFFENYHCKNNYNIMYGLTCYHGKIYKDYINIVIDLEEPNFLDYSDERLNKLKKFDKKRQGLLDNFNEVFVYMSSQLKDAYVHINNLIIALSASEISAGSKSE